MTTFHFEVRDGDTILYGPSRGFETLAEAKVAGLRVALKDRALRRLFTIKTRVVMVRVRS